MKFIWKAHPLHYAGNMATGLGNLIDSVIMILSFGFVVSRIGMSITFFRHRNGIYYRPGETQDFNTAIKEIHQHAIAKHISRRKSQIRLRVPLIYRDSLWILR